MGLQSLPVAFGVDTAKWITVGTIDVTQFAVAAYLAVGLHEPVYAAVLTALILPQARPSPQGTSEKHCARTGHALGSACCARPPREQSRARWLWCHTPARRRPAPLRLCRPARRRVLCAGVQVQLRT